MNINNFIIDSDTKLLCLIGNPIEHSMSPVMQNIALRDLNLDYVYLAFDVIPKNLKKAIKGLKSLNVRGFNVTIPHKQKVINFIEEIDPIAEKIGAVNTIKNEMGCLIGKNTDGIGAKIALQEANYTIKNKQILILGSGGAARAISFTLANDCDEIIIVNRTIKKAEQLVRDLSQETNGKFRYIEFNFDKIKQELNSIDLLINTTPVGMYPDITNSPIPKTILTEHLFIFDVIYNPLTTKLLKDAQDLGCKTLNGVDMLINQGSLAFEWWTNHKPNKNLMKEKITEVLS